MHHWLLEAPRAVYIKWLVLLLLAAVLTNAFGTPFNKPDYVIVLFVIAIDDINEYNFFGLSIVFGIAYDLNSTAYIGIGFFLFLFLTLITVKSHNLLETQSNLKIVFYLCLVAGYTVITLAINSYKITAMPTMLVKYMVYNFLCLLILYLLQRGKDALSKS